MLYHKSLILAATKAASTDMSRSALTAIHLDGKRIEATDGHVLIRFETVPMPDAEFPALNGDTPREKSTLVPGKVALDATKACAKKSCLPILSHVQLVEHEGKVKLISTDLEQTYTGSVNEPDAIYPNCDAVMPKGKPVFRIGLGVETTLKLFGAFKAAGVHDVVVDAYDPLKALRITAKIMDDVTADVIALLMPVRIAEGQ